MNKTKVIAVYEKIYAFDNLTMMEDIMGLLNEVQKNAELYDMIKINSVFMKILNAYEKKDYLMIADIMKYELADMFEDNCHE